MNYRYLLYNLVNRDFKVKYRRSFLGVVWSVLNPLLMMLVMMLVFTWLFSMYAQNGMPVVAATGLPPPFAVYLLSGQLIFNFFNEATTSAMDSVLNNAQLIKKVYIPKYIFPLEKVLFSLINTLFSFLALALVMLITLSPLSWWALLSPVVVLLLAVFNLGVGLILSSAVVYFRDIKHFYTVFVLMLTYLTPIFYTETIVPVYWIRMLMRVNPMYWYVGMFRDVAVYGVAPSPYTWLATTGCAGVVLLAGLAVFRRSQDSFILHV